MKGKEVNRSMKKIKVVVLTKTQLTMYTTSPIETPK
jgi:hypothetical protein